MSDPTEPCLNCPDCGHPQEMSIGRLRPSASTSLPGPHLGPVTDSCREPAASGTVELPTVLAGAEKQP